MFLKQLTGAENDGIERFYYCKINTELCKLVISIRVEKSRISLLDINRGRADKQ